MHPCHGTGGLPRAQKACHPPGHGVQGRIKLLSSPLSQDTSWGDKAGEAGQPLGPIIKKTP